MTDEIFPIWLRCLLLIFGPYPLRSPGKCNKLVIFLLFTTLLSSSLYVIIAFSSVDLYKNIFDFIIVLFDVMCVLYIFQRRATLHNLLKSLMPFIKKSIPNSYHIIWSSFSFVYLLAKLGFFIYQSIVVVPIRFEFYAYDAYIIVKHCSYCLGMFWTVCQLIFFAFIALCLTQAFCQLNLEVRNEAPIDSVLEKYFFLVDLVSKANKIYGTSLFLILTKFFLLILGLVSIYLFDVNYKQDLLFTVVEIIMYSFPFIFICAFGAFVEDESSQIPGLYLRKLNDLPADKVNILVVLETGNYKASIVAGGFLTINRSTLFQIFGLILTYAVVIIQFGQAKQQG